MKINRQQYSKGIRAKVLGFADFIKYWEIPLNFINFSVKLFLIP